MEVIIVIGPVCVLLSLQTTAKVISRFHSNLMLWYHGLPVEKNRLTFSSDHMTQNRTYSLICAEHQQYQLPATEERGMVLFFVSVWSLLFFRFDYIVIQLSWTHVCICDSFGRGMCVCCRHDNLTRNLLADEIGECYGEIERRGGEVLQRWCGSGGNRNFSVTFAYLIYCLAACY